MSINVYRYGIDDTFTVFRIRNFHNFFDLYILESYKLSSNGPFNIGWLLIFS